MPKDKRKDIPRTLLAHLVLRIKERSISADALKSFAAWLDTNPEVPADDWYKRFPTMTVCGNDTLVKTFLTPDQVPIGKEV